MSTRIFQPIALRSLATAMLLCSGFVSTAKAQSLSVQTFGDVLKQASTLSISNAGAGESTLSGTDALWIDTLEAELGASAGSLGQDALEGSAILAHVSSASPFTLQFNWQLLSDQVTPTPGFDDRAFVLIDGQRFDLGPWQGQGLFRHTFAHAGSHSLSIGLLDVGDVAGVSQLHLSGLQVSPVPEPQSAALLGLGLLAVTGWAGRRQSR